MTYTQLKEKGILLMGPVVPEWFKLICDGCSIPKGFKWAGGAKRSIAICRIHDLRYYIIPFSLQPDNPFRKLYRMTADFELKMNRRKISKHKLMGRSYAMAYFWGVRVAAKKSLNKSADLLVVMGPRTHEDLDELLEVAEGAIPHYDAEWRDAIVTRIRTRIDLHDAEFLGHLIEIEKGDGNG